jgi:hypothetical protein
MIHMRTLKDVHLNAAESRAAEPVARLWLPHAPWPKQQQFLNLFCKEAFYGGAAAGGKSEALLMAALMFAHVPGYAALILRKDTQRLQLSGGLIPRSHEWLANTPATWHAAERRWKFPTHAAPATLSFGYLQTSGDKYRYGSSEYQFIGFDELTEFVADDYLFLFSRLRKRTEIDVPLRMRSASNPGNVGHDWVLRRFITPAAIAAAGETAHDALAGKPVSNTFWCAGRAYVPARIRDNHAILESEYAESLSHLPPLFRERLLNGDWSVREQGLIAAGNLARYGVQGEYLQFIDEHGRSLGQVHERACWRIATCDPAGTSADRAKEQRGKPPCWTAIQVWDLAPDPWSRQMLLRHVERVRVDFAELCQLLRRVYLAWRPAAIYIEEEKLGRAAFDILSPYGLPIETISPRGKDKVVRASQLLTRLARCEVRLPREPLPWLADLESEWLRWTGLPEEVCDQIDAAAYAAMIAEAQNARRIVIQPFLSTNGV